jgi:hypothetical protein
MSGKWKALCLLLIVSSPALWGQMSPNGLQCIANAAVPPTLRSEGVTELTGDIVLICQGGTPTAAGTTIPTADITIFYNSMVTSRVLNGANQSEVVLTVDEPPPAQTSAAQTCTSTSGCAAIAAGPGQPNKVEFQQQFTNAGTTVTNPNAFQGVVNGNSVTFSGIPIDPPGTQGGRIYRITNVRIDATTVAPGAFGAPGQAVALISATPVTLPNGQYSTFAINNPTQIVGFVLPSLSTSARDAADASTLTAPVAVPANLALTRVATLRFSELFSTAFKRLTIPALASSLNDPTVAEQNTLGMVYNAETGYYNTKLGFAAGLADSGTRFKAHFTGIPAGVRLFVDTTYISQSSLAVMTAAESGPFSPVAATNGSAAEIPISGGVATAVWEYLGQAVLTIDNLDFGVYAVTSGNPAPGTVSVNLSYAPVWTSSGAAVPRFVDTSTRVNLISTSTNPCSFSIVSPATLGTAVVGMSYGPVTLGACGLLPTPGLCLPDPCQVGYS